MAIKVVNSSPGTIKVSVSETSTVTVSSPDNSVISVEPGITPAERSKLASIDAGASADQVLTGGTNINVSESSGDYTINLDNSIDLSGTLDVSGDATLDSDLTVAGDITVSDSGGAIFQTQSSADNINVRAQTVKFPGSFGVNIQSTASGAGASLKSNSGTVSLDGTNVTLTMGGGSSRKQKCTTTTLCSLKTDLSLRAWEPPLFIRRLLPILEQSSLKLKLLVLRHSLLSTFRLVQTLGDTSFLLLMALLTPSCKLTVQEL